MNSSFVRGLITVIGLIIMIVGAMLAFYYGYLAKNLGWLIGGIIILVVGGFVVVYPKE